MKTLELLNKDVVVLSFRYDEELHRIESIDTIEDSAFAPPGLVGPSGNITLKNLIRWWAHRSIPASRAQIERLKSALRIETTVELLEKSLALSLSDRYWVREQGQQLAWSEVNFFDNDFTGELGIYTLEPSSSPVVAQLGERGLLNPNSSVGGNLPKKWVIENGVRYLVKNGSQNYDQDIYNEVVATSLHRRLLCEEEYVSYELVHIGNGIYCRCPELLADNEELVTIDDLLRRHVDDHDFGSCLSVRKALLETGLPSEQIDEGLSKLFTCDYILANSDRHTNNFGVIRDVSTLEYKRLAPVFDTGFSLWCDKRELAYPSDYDYVARPFVNTPEPYRQLRLLDSYDWFDADALSGWIEEARSILEVDSLIPEERLDAICRGLERTVFQTCERVKRATGRGLM